MHIQNVVTISPFKSLLFHSHDSLGPPRKIFQGYSPCGRVLGSNWKAGYCPRICGVADVDALRLTPSCGCSFAISGSRLPDREAISLGVLPLRYSPVPLPLRPLRPGRPSASVPGLYVHQPPLPALSAALSDGRSTRTKHFLEKRMVILYSFNIEGLGHTLNSGCV